MRASAACGLGQRQRLRRERLEREGGRSLCMARHGLPRGAAWRLDAAACGGAGAAVVARLLAVKHERGPWASKETPQGGRGGARLRLGPPSWLGRLLAWEGRAWPCRCLAGPAARVEGRGAGLLGWASAAAGQRGRGGKEKEKDFYFSKGKFERIFTLF